MMPAGFSCSDIQDRALVIVQLHGGNDGLNTFLPVDQYSLYRNYRPIIGIPDTGPRSYINLDTTLPVADQVGLNPDLGAFKALYDQGKARVIQQVSYPSNNGSHFRGTDIWLTGNDGNTMPEHPSSGWWGRYLNHWYPNYPAAYPNTDMMDPPGLEFGSHIVSLGFHREVGIPMGLTLSNDPSGFYNLVSGLGGALPDNFPASDYGDELRYIVEIERSTNVYAQRLSDVFALGGNTVTYPDTYHTNAASHYRNPLSAQLRTVARLLSGGSRTKIFLVRMGGFDTHANQGIPDKPSFGGHSALLYHLSQALKAFQDDLQGLGIEDRVMTVTFSEFGRQVAENGTFGTDHGTSAPMMVIGKGVNPGVSGTNPNLSSLSNNNLTGYQHDYRQVFTTLLQDWLGANNGTLDEVGFYPFSGQKLPLVNTQYVDTSGTTVDYTADITCDQTPDLPALKVDAGLNRRTELQVFPNPAHETASLSLTWDRMQPATLLLADIAGHSVRTQEIRLYAGAQTVELDITGLSPGTYVVLLTLPHAGKRPVGSTKLVIL
jgi:uncharacterized protein (DUF1501 family)